MEDAMTQWTNAKLCDVGNLILGGILFFSPWLFSFAAGVETQNAVIAGIVIAVLSIAALAAFAIWEEWLNLIVGLWLIISPWVLKFQATTAMRVDVAIGIVVAVLAAVEIWMTMQLPSRQASNR
jgi:SPW repeat